MSSASLEYSVWSSPKSLSNGHPVAQRPIAQANAEFDRLGKIQGPRSNDGLLNARLLEAATPRLDPGRNCTPDDVGGSLDVL